MHHKMQLQHRLIKEVDQYDQKVGEVKLVETNPSYARIRYDDGRESKVSLKHIAPLPSPDAGDDDSLQEPISLTSPDRTESLEPILNPEQSESDLNTEPRSSETPEPEQKVVRRSERARKEPDRLQYTH